MSTSFVGTDLVSESVERLTDTQLRAIVRIAESALATGNQRTEQFVSGVLMAELKPDFCGVWREDEGDSTAFRLVAVGGDVEVSSESQELYSGSQAQYVSFSEVPVTVLDVRSEDRFAPAHPLLRNGMVSGISVPLIGSTSCIGVLDVYWRSARRLTPGEFSFLQLAAMLCASGLDNAANSERIARESVQAHVLIEIGKVVASSLHFGEVFTRFAQLLESLIPCDRISLALVDHDSGVCTTAYHTGLDLEFPARQEQYLLSESIYGEVLRLRRPLIINSLNRDEYTRKFPRYNRSVDAGVASTLSVPITWRDRVIAVLTMHSLQQDVFDHYHSALATRVAALIAGAVANAEMHKTLDRLAAERLRLTEIGRAVNSAPDEKTAFMHLTRGIGQLMAVDRVVLALVGDAGRRLRRRFVTGLPIDGWGEDTVVNVSESAARRALETGRPVVYFMGQPEPPGSAKSVEEKLGAAGISSVMYVPLAFGGEHVGVVSVCSRRANAYGQHEMSLAERLASLTSAFLATLRVSDRSSLMNHQLELACTLLERRDLKTEPVEFVSSIEEKIVAAAMCDLFIYCERDGASLELKVAHSGGLSSHLVEVGEVIASLDETGRTVTDETVREHLRAAGFQSSLWEPVMGPEGVTGVLGIFAYRQQAMGVLIQNSMTMLAKFMSVQSGRVPGRNSFVGATAANRFDDHVEQQNATFSDLETANIVICDAHPACRGSIRVQLSGKPLNVVGECRSIEDAASAADGPCDVVIWGLHSSDKPSRIRAAARYSHLFRTLVVTDRLSVDGLREALRAGVAGYVSRDSTTRKLEADLNTLLHGGTVIDSNLLSVFFSEMPAGVVGLTATETSLLEGLTERDRTILTELARGSSNEQIARDLNLAVGSVKNRMVEIYRRIGVADRVEAAAFAIRAGLQK